MINRNRSRESALRLIGQAHVLPGMSLARWYEIVWLRHGVCGTAKDAWSKIPDATLDAIVADIQAVTAEVRQ